MALAYWKTEARLLDHPDKLKYALAESNVLQALNSSPSFLIHKVEFNTKNQQIQRKKCESRQKQV